MKLRTLKPAVKPLDAPKLRTATGSWRDGRTTAQRGYGGRWQRARRFFLQRNPLCVFCKEKGRIELATVVDHIEPHKGDPVLFWKYSNWQGLCKPCHDSIKKQMEAGNAGPVQVGLDGWPVEPGGSAP